MGAAGIQQSPDDEGEAERLNTYNRIIPAAGGELGGTTPSAGAQHPRHGVSADES